MGDIFNIIGAVLQKVLPTMIILAVYYTLADLVLLAQCLWYRRRVEGGDERVVEEREEEEEQEEEDTRPLLQREPESPRKYSAVDADGRGRKGSRNGSFSSLQTRLAGLDASRLSRSSPYAGSRRPLQAVAGQKIIKVEPTASSSTAAAVLSNISALALVTLAGVLGWYLSSRSHQFPDSGDDHHVDPISSSSSILATIVPASTSTSTAPLTFSLWGQIFGYLCAILYLLSRLPQILLNARRKSVEGLSTLFFLFACLGNITYVASIFAYEPPCAASSSFFPAFKNNGVSGGGGEKGMSEGSFSGCGNGEWREGYTRYILVNLSWILGSAGTLILDFTVLAQFWVYRGRRPREEVGGLL